MPALVEIITLYPFATQGFAYLFLAYQTWFGKFFWAMVIVAMAALGIYFCVQEPISRSLHLEL
jgi:hypothetical protein